tara:strand:+ start:8835 stop:9371 length:537 start_codon:yes stop_codon:yes gene_type:complete
MSNPDSMYGVVNGFYECNMARTEELNERLNSRRIPSSNLQPQYSLRPVSTKYAVMPIMDRHAPSTVPLRRYPNYNVAKTFNPGNTVSHWSGFATCVNDESRLRNQFFALQKSDNGEYIPSTRSDLYNMKIESKPTQQPFPGLFQEEKFKDFDPNVCNLGNNLFDNCTRVQLKQLSDKK